MFIRELLALYVYDYFEMINPTCSFSLPLSFGTLKYFFWVSFIINCLYFSETLSQDDALYASFFWWRDYYEVRNRAEDRAQAYCDLCSRLNNPNEPPKVYKNMHKWWVEDSGCKKYNVRTK